MEPVHGTLVIITSKKTNKPQYHVEFTNLKGKPVSHVLEEKAKWFKPGDATPGALVTIELGNDQKPIKVTIDGKDQITPNVQHPRPDYTGGRPPRPHAPNAGPNRPGAPNPAPPRPGAPNVRPIRPHAPNVEPNRPGATAPYNFIPYDSNKIVPSNYNPKLETYSGTIHCNFEALTPLLVASNYNSTEDEKSKEKSFLRVNNSAVIPGSSFKGMFRSVIEILSYSFLNPINDNNLYYRKFDLNSPRYLQFMGTTTNPRQKAGWLVPKGSDYVIYPAMLLTHKDKNAVPVEVNKIKGSTSATYYFSPCSTNYNPIELDKEIFNKFADQITVKQEEYLEKRIGSRNIYNLNEKKPLPIFYIEEFNSNNILFIGLPKFFRIHYDYRPTDYIQPSKSAPNIDFASGLFGFAKTDSAQKGRISFSHSEVSGSEIPKVTVTLGQPSVSCLTHYLVQNQATLIDYNNKDAKIRGRKCYWHRAWNPEEINNAGNDNTKSVLVPLGAKAKGNFTVNLSRVTLEELGAVFLALELWDESAHKLGLGKPIGLGSIKVSIKDFNVTKFSEQYSSLSARLSKTNKKQGNNISKEEAIKAFKEYICKTISYNKSKNNSSYDTLEEIKHFRAIVDYKNKPEYSKTKYLELKEFKKSPPLPDILSIYKK
jgi:CRISPR/Cas system CSM-associated protein Csm3 (group 7 of RAMP superfamily)